MDQNDPKSLLNTAKSHKERRKLIKKFRRKKIRKKLAEERDEIERKLEEEKLRDPAYLTNLAEQKVLELMREEQIQIKYQEDQKRFLENEKQAQIKFEERQKILKEQEEKTQSEVQKKRELLEKHRKLVDEKEKRREQILTEISDYIKGTAELPEELKIPIETNPGQELCHFFLKTGCCRFNDRCLKNHVRPGVSNVVMIPNFFQHILLDQHRSENELYSAFVEFYNDVLPEFEQIGKVTQFRVCYNQQSHIKGNVFVEFKEERKAIEAYQLMYGRFYAGRKIYSELVTINSWRAAICGLAFKQKCPKSAFCNFLHVFKNPNNRFPIIDERQSVRSLNSSIRSERINGWNGDLKIERCNWRWSETPEIDTKRINSSRRQPGGLYSEKVDIRNHRNSIDSHSERRKRSRSRDRTSRRSDSKSKNNHSRRRSRSRSRRRRSRSRSRSRSKKASSRRRSRSRHKK